MTRLGLGLVLVGLALAGCVSSPAYVSCTGKGVVSHQVQTMGYGGLATITLDCGDGLIYEQRKYAPREPK
jgi:hypothetical protein